MWVRGTKLRMCHHTFFGATIPFRRVSSPETFQMCLNLSVKLHKYIIQVSRATNWPWTSQTSHGHSLASLMMLNTYLVTWFFNLAIIIWAPSSEFVSSSIPSWQISTAHAQPFRGARDLAFCLRFLLIHCLYERAAKILARLRGCAGSPEPSLLA